jgi:methylmalonyl-CoA mutase
MDDDTLVLAGGFPAATHDEWVAAVGKVLIKGEATPEEIDAAIDKRLTTRTYDGIAIAPLYTDGPDAGTPGVAPFTRGSRAAGGWDVRQRVELDGSGTAAIVLNELERGATSVYLGVAEAPLVDAATLTAALDGVLLDVAPVVLETGENWAAAGAALLEVLEAGGGSGSLGADPIGVLASRGIAPDPAALVALAERSRGHDIRSIVVDSTRYLDAGSSDSEEIGCSLATGVAYLRWLTEAGFSVADAAAQIEFRIAVTANQFTTIAKLRAARQAWARITEVSGATAAQRQHAVTARAMTTRYDPWVNLLRGTTACFAAAAGGADAISVTAFDALREPTATSMGRRLSRNTQMLLALESNIGKVADPGGGSWYIETLTQELAAAAWTWFQDIEAAGGIVAALNAGVVQQRIATTWAARKKKLATRRDPLTGLSEFPDIDENLPALADDEAPAAPNALPRVRYADGFEALRDRARGIAAPSVFLASLGPAAVHTARATFAKNLFEAAGIRAPGNDGFDSPDAAAAAFRADGARIACICSSDAVYAEQASATATALKAAGASRVYLAGNPGDRRDEYLAAGIDEFVFMGVDAEVILGAALAALEATS